MVDGLAVAWLAANATSHAAMWALAPLLAATTYLISQNLKMALGERLLVAAGDPDADDASP